MGVKKNSKDTSFIMSEKKELEASPEQQVNNTENANNSETASNSKSKPISSKPKKAKKSRKRKLSQTSSEQKDSTEPLKKKRKKQRGWSQKEEELFLSGLEEFGRDWNKIAVKVGNERNAASIRSHAQIHFLKLLKNGNKLPPKVKESGNGYTLGGDALNKYSSTAIRYFGGADKVPMVDGVISDKEGAEKLKRPKKNKGSKDVKKEK